MKETTFVRKKMKNLRNDFLQLLFETSKIKLLLLPIKIYQQLPYVRKLFYNAFTDKNLSTVPLSKKTFIVYPFKS